MNFTARDMIQQVLIAATLILLACASAVAQFQGADPVRQAEKVCGYQLASGFSFSSNNEASQALSKVIQAAGLLPNHFVILAADVDNALACEDNNSSNRYILFNPSWIKGLSLGDNANTDWIRLGILAHEVGHHALNHYLKGMRSTPQLELEADEFAGKVLAALGATLTQAQSAFRQPSMCSEEGGGTHPKCSLRLAAVASGWRQVASQLDSNPLTKADVINAFKAMPEYNVIDISPYIDYMYSTLSQSGIKTHKQFHDFLTSQPIRDTLSQIYVEELLREEYAPLDPEGIVIYGSFLYKNGISEGTIKAIKDAIRTSQEYKQKHPQIK